MPMKIYSNKLCPSLLTLSFFVCPLVFIAMKKGNDTTFLDNCPTCLMVFLHIFLLPFLGQNLFDVGGNNFGDKTE